MRRHVGDRQRHLVGTYLTEEPDQELLEWVRSLPKGHFDKAMKTGLVLTQFLRTVPQGDGFYRRGILLEALKTGLMVLPTPVHSAGTQPLQALPMPAAGHAQPIDSVPLKPSLTTLDRDPENDLNRLLGK